MPRRRKAKQFFYNFSLVIGYTNLCRLVDRQSWDYLKFAIRFVWLAPSTPQKSDEIERVNERKHECENEIELSKSNPRLRGIVLKIMIIFVYDICDIMGTCW